MQIYYDLNDAAVVYMPQAVELQRGSRVYLTIPGLRAAKILYLRDSIANAPRDEVVRFGRSLLGVDIPVIIDFAERQTGNDRWWMQQEVFVNPAAFEVVRDNYIQFIHDLRQDNPNLEVGVIGSMPPAERHVEPEWHELIRAYGLAMQPLLNELSFSWGGGYHYPAKTNMADWAAAVEDEWIEIRRHGLENFLWLSPIWEFEGQPLTPNLLLREQIIWARQHNIARVGLWSGGADTVHIGEANYQAIKEFAMTPEEFAQMTDEEFIQSYEQHALEMNRRQAETEARMNLLYQAEATIAAHVTPQPE